MNRLKIEDGDNGKAECEVCHYPAPTEFCSILKDPANSLSKRNVRMCEICSNSYAGTAFEHNHADMKVLAHISFTTNAVLDQMGAFKDVPIEYYRDDE
jgi:hypothetical protein